MVPMKAVVTSSWLSTGVESGPNQLVHPPGGHPKQEQVAATVISAVRPGVSSQLVVVFLLGSRPGPRRRQG